MGLLSLNGIQLCDVRLGKQQAENLSGTNEQAAVRLLQLPQALTIKEKHNPPRKVTVLIDYRHPQASLKSLI